MSSSAADAERWLAVHIFIFCVRLLRVCSFDEDGQYQSLDEWNELQVRHSRFSVYISVSLRRGPGDNTIHYDMRVYARYFSDEARHLNFRRDTVLQFGDSWDTIGAAVLVNPGSAFPIGVPDDLTVRCLSALTGQEDSWQQFSPDPTMRQLAKIFNGWYAGSERPLDGCILLYNLFNLRDKNMGEALELCHKSRSEHLFTTETDIRQLSGQRRIYLGWGNAGKYQLRQYAEPIFEAVRENCPYLDPVFDRNAFYHPGYVNRSYRNNPTTRLLVNDFIKN